MSSVPVISGDAVRAAISAADAVERTRHAFQQYARGEWAMPPKVYVDAPPRGDFRAMPARGDGYAALKWVTSFPANTERGLPVVRGLLLLSDAETGEELAVIDCASITSLRTGGAAAVSAQALAREDADSVGLIGSGVNGAWAARCLAAVGFARGIVHDARSEPAVALADELGWTAGTREEAASQDVVVTVTPGDTPVIGPGDLRSGQHLAVLGADAHGKAEVELEAIERCRLFCDEWKQASAGGELAHAADAGVADAGSVTPIGDVLIGTADGRRSDDETTLFDSTGLAIQDLSLAIAVYEGWREGSVEAIEARL